MGLKSRYCQGLRELHLLGRANVLLAKYKGSPYAVDFQLLLDALMFNLPEINKRCKRNGKVYIK